MKPRVVADYACEVGEGPIWNPHEGRLYWTDILTGRLFWYEPQSGRHRQCYEGRQVGGMTVQADGSLLLFGQNGSVRVWRDGRIAGTVVDEIPAERGKRFNDVIADPRGRVLCGTLGDISRREGTLYRLDGDGKYTALIEGVQISNGMGFSPDLTHLYYTDTGVDTIYVFDFDVDTGSISNRRVFVDLSGQAIKPDGMTVDAQGNIWSAMARGDCVIRYSPEGRELLRITFPTKFISSVTFGGEGLDRLYVTSGSGNDKQGWGPTAGALFELDAGVTGMADFQSRILI